MPRYATLMRFDFTIDTPWAIGAFTRAGATGEDAVQAPIQRRPPAGLTLVAPRPTRLPRTRCQTDRLGDSAGRALGIEAGA